MTCSDGLIPLVCRVIIISLCCVLPDMHRYTIAMALLYSLQSYKL